MKSRVIAITAAMAFCAPRAYAALPFCNTAGTTAPTPANSHAASEYPVLSLDLHEEGATLVEFVIGADGKVSAPAVAQSSGSLRLDDASKEAVLSWTYNPAMSGGLAVACLWQAQVRWLMPDEKKAPEKAQ